MARSKKLKNKPKNIGLKEVHKYARKFNKLIDETEDEASSEITKSGKKAKSKFTSEMSDSLSVVSSFDTNFSSNLELMRKLRTLLLECLKVCDGAYRSKPTQGNSYALTNMVSQIKDITDRLEEAIDYEQVTNTLIEDIIKPFIEKMILDLGSIISGEIDQYDKKERKLISTAINKIYKKYGSKIETKIPTLSESILKNILNSVS